jgi:hypothetical protein
MILLILVGVFHYVFFYYQTYQANDNINQVETMHKEVEWSMIEGTLDFATHQAKTNADNVAKRVVEAIEKQYPDKSVLSDEFERGMYYSPKFLSIISKEISGHNMYGFDSNRNDIFVLSRNGIIMDNNVEFHKATHRSIGEELNSHYNHQLGYNAIDALLNKIKTDVIFYEPISPYRPSGHKKVGTPNKSTLRAVFEEEGIEGLAGYVMLVPSYITEDGDIFGTPDISPDGIVNSNFKIVVVQRFSVYDIIRKQDLTTHTEHDVYAVAKNGYTDMLKSSTVSYICITILDMIALCFLIIIVTRKDDKKEE